MSKDFSRTDLYELVWSQPRTSLAKELGVSDVAIGKHCAHAHIPVPPSGYWAKLRSGKKVARTPLPIRLPGQIDIATIGRPEPWVYPPRGEEPGEPPVAHVFAEDIEEQILEATRRIGRVVATRDLRLADPGLARLLSSEAKLREKHKEWSFYEPHFDDANHQRQLRIFNSFARALGMLYGRQEVRDEEEFVRGRGTLHRPVLHLSFGGATIALRFQEPGDHLGERRTRAVKATTLRASSNEAIPDQEWVDQDGLELELQLTDIVPALLRQAELSLRASEERRIEFRKERRRELLTRLEAREVEDERQRLAALEAHRLKVRDEIVAIAGRFRLAEDIRATVSALRMHPGTAANRPHFEAWAERANEVARAIDPMLSPLDEIIGPFGVAEQRRPG